MMTKRSPKTFRKQQKQRVKHISALKTWMFTAFANGAMMQAYPTVESLNMDKVRAEFEEFWNKSMLDVQDYTQLPSKEAE